MSDRCRGPLRKHGPVELGHWKHGWLCWRCWDYICRREER